MTSLTHSRLAQDANTQTVESQVVPLGDRGSIPLPRTNDIREVVV